MSVNLFMTTTTNNQEINFQKMSFFMLIHYLLLKSLTIKYKVSEERS